MNRHLKDILLEKQTKITELGKDGTYIAVHFSTETQNALKSLAEALEVDNKVTRKKMHCTIVYSRKPFKDFTVHGKMKEPWIGTPTKLEIFPTQTGSRALVLRFDCKEMKDRHEYFNKEYGAQYDYDEYKIHATLSYDVGKDWQIPKNFDIKKYVDKIEVVEEYYQPLELDWAKDASDTKDGKESK
ncbi:hypothetical protein Xoosp13_184 [Xanthomonas phage Xoo-sp13]|nr:hypothetical protein Xoosp13_184 [Xanthomonas phage Xoo-sp13]